MNGRFDYAVQEYSWPGPALIPQLQVHQGKLGSSMAEKLSRSEPQSGGCDNVCRGDRLLYLVNRRTIYSNSGFCLFTLFPYTFCHDCACFVSNP